MGDSQNLRVMIAGIGGASLGTELLKCLQLAARYDVYGCDISPTAYGMYDSGFTRAFLVDRDHYIDSIIAACHEAGASWLVPGGEQPMVLLGANAERLAAQGIRLVANPADFIQVFSDKAATFSTLSSLGIDVPHTVEVASEDDLAAVGMPCIVKPATGTGGSAMVFFAVDEQEAMIYAEYIRRNGSTPIAQEYVSPDEGEFTVGVLSLPDGKVVGSIALRRCLDSKLSVMSRGRGGLVSSGYSQGYIGDFPEIREQAESIARKIGSCGPINIQARVRDGVLVPFEINPRLSASTYLRALAGFNEVDILLSYLSTGEYQAPEPLREGWYLRSLTEGYVAPEDMKK